MRGARITEYCNQFQLSVEERLRLFILVCQAVQHAHQKGVIHRDLKPSNILVTVNDGVPVPKVIDFGIAKATDQRLTERTFFTEFHAFIGTPAYTSPEQAEMSSMDIDTRSDIYSLGVLLYELLTRQTPFSTERLLKSGLDEMRRIIREEEPERPSLRLTQLNSASAGRKLVSRPSSLATDLDWIVMKALEKDRARRYDTANNFAQDIQRHLDDEPVVACPPSNLYRAQKFVRRNKFAVAAASAISAALVIGLGISTWALFREREAFTRVVAAEKEQRRERDRAATLLSVSQAERGVRLLGGNDSSGLLYLLEARQSVEHLPEERALRTLLWNGWYDSNPRSEDRLLRITDPVENQVPNAAFCVEREWVATGTSDGQVLVWNINTGRQLTALKTEILQMDTRLLAAQAATYSRLPIEFSSDGRLLAAQAGPYFELWNMIPLISNQPPHRLVAGATKLAFDPQRRFAVTVEAPNLGRAPIPAGEDPNIQVIKVWSEDALQIRTLRLDRSELNLMDSVALSPGGTQLATGGDSLRLRNLTDGTWIGPSPRANDPSANDVGRHRFYSPEGRWLWEGAAGAYQRYDALTGNPVGDPFRGSRSSPSARWSARTDSVWC